MQQLVSFLHIQSFRNLFLIVLLLFVVIVFSRQFFIHPTFQYWSTPLSGAIIAIDAGHGGPDGGAVSKSGIIEKDINLAIALYLRDFLQEAGAVVVMTREKDEDLADENPPGSRKTQDLHRRADKVRAHHADMLISIHMNSIGSSRWSGAQTFYYSGHETSKYLAAFIQGELTRNLENTSRVARPADTIYLLKSASVPSTLVEAGFLSNAAEAQMLANSEYQKQVAASIYQGILRYHSERDKLPTS